MKLILLCVAVVLLASVVELVLLKFHKTYSLDERFRTANITPDVYYTSPESLLQLSFGLDFEESFEVITGSEISPADAIGQPVMGFDYKVGSNYTFLIVGPDEPSPDCAYLSLYIVVLYVNVYGSADGVNTDDSCEIVTYIPPNPPPGTGKHRYVAYVFEQSGFIDTSNPELQGLQINRFGNTLDDFVSCYELIGPIAGTFFYVEYPLCSA